MINRPFYFLVVLWGEDYRNYFTKYCLASLLSENNIGSLAPHLENKFLICTTETDWEQFQVNKLFKLLQEKITVEWLPLTLENKSNYTRDYTMYMMSKGHCQLATAAYDAKAYGVFVYPEMLVADGAILALQKLAQTEKYDVVQALAVRFCNGGVLDDLRNEGYIAEDKPITISPRALIKLALRSIHSETKRMNWDASLKSDGIGAVHFPVLPNQALQFYSGNFAPMLLNYGNLEKHDTSTFQRWTLDGDYIYKNFKNPKRVYLVQDSDELMVLGFTEESHCKYPLEILQFKNQFFHKLHKISSIKNSIFKNPAIDKLKLKLFMRPIRIHACDVDNKKWKEVHLRARFYFTLASLLSKIYFPEFIIRGIRKIRTIIISRLDPIYAMRKNGFFSNILSSDIIGIRLNYVSEQAADKIYLEFLLPNINLDNCEHAQKVSIGLVDEGHALTTMIGSNEGCGMRMNGNLYHHGSVQTITGIEFNSLKDRTTVRLAWDRKGGHLWWGVNDQWIGGGNPESGLNPTLSGLKKEMFPAVTSQGTKRYPIVCWKILKRDWRFKPPIDFKECISDNHENSIPHNWVATKISKNMRFIQIKKLWFLMFFNILIFPITLLNFVKLKIVSIKEQLNEI